MFYKNIFLSDGSCTIKNKKFLNNTIFVLDTKNSIHWNIKKKKKKENILNIFKTKFLKRK